MSGVITSVDDPYDGSVDLVILLQHHPEYDLARLAASTVPLLDTRGVLEESELITRL